MSATLLLLWLSVPPQIPAPAPHARLLHLEIAAQMVLQGADLATSEYAFGKTGTHFREANPLLGWAQHRPVTLGALKMGLAVGVSYALLTEHRTHPTLSLLGASVFNVLETLVVVKNHQQLAAVK